MTVVFPIDMKAFRRNPEPYREAFRKRFLDESVVDKALELDREWRKLQRQVEMLRAEVNTLTRIYAVIKSREDYEEVITSDRRMSRVWAKYGLAEKVKARGVDAVRELSSQINEEIARLEVEVEEKLNKLIRLLYVFPNFLDPSVPIGPDESYNKVVKYWGRPRVWRKHLDAFLEENLDIKDYEVIDWEPKHHYDLVKEFDLVDTDTAAKIAGARFYIEKNILPLLDFALSMYALHFYVNKGFDNIVVPPYLMRRSIEEKITYYESFKESIYHVVEDDLILITTSEHPIVAMYMDHTFNEEDLPLRILAWSPAFRKEAGAHGKDTKGIFRTHQFHKVELHSITTLDSDMEELEYLLKVTEEFIRTLNIPYRVVLLSSGDMDKRAKIQYDIEAWFPGQGRYRELFSLATMGDWASRKVMTKVRRKGREEFVANLYATGVAIQRTLCAVFENHYDPEEDVIRIPKPLTKYLEGVGDVIRRKTT